MNNRRDHWTDITNPADLQVRIALLLVATLPQTPSSKTPLQPSLCYRAKHKPPASRTAVQSLSALMHASNGKVFSMAARWPWPAASGTVSVNWLTSNLRHCSQRGGILACQSRNRLFVSGVEVPPSLRHKLAKQWVSSWRRDVALPTQFCYCGPSEGNQTIAATSFSVEVNISYNDPKLKNLHAELEKLVRTGESEIHVVTRVTDLSQARRTSPSRKGFKRQVRYSELSYWTMS